MRELLARGTREQIINFLSRKWPLSTKSIYLHVKKHKQCTYQAVHKTLQEMLHEGVLDKQGKSYSLSVEWIKRLKSMSEILERTYAGQEQIAYPKTYTFKTAIAMGRFLINKFLQLPNPENKPAVCRWRHMYSLIGLSKEEMDRLKASSAKTKYNMLCQKSTSFDRFLATAYNDLGGEVLLSVDGVGDPDIFVCGDYIAEVHTPREYKNEWDVIYHSYGTPAFDVNSVLQMMHEKQWKLLVTINKDPVLAEQMRVDTLKRFTEPQQQSEFTLIQSGHDHAQNAKNLFKNATHWKELSHDLGLPYTFYSGDTDDFMHRSRIVYVNRSAFSEGILYHYQDIFEFFKKHKMQWIVQIDALKWHYALLKKAYGEREAREMFRNPERNREKYGVETRVLRKSVPFSIGVLSNGMWILYPRNDSVSGFSSRDPKAVATFNRIFNSYWVEAEPYNAKRILREISR